MDYVIPILCRGLANIFEKKLEIAVQVVYITRLSADWLGGKEYSRAERA
jgi:hypothetical protein